MNCRLHISVEPLSVNAMTFRDKRFKSTKYKRWETAVLISLNSEDNQAEIQKIRKAYKKDKHCFAVKLQALYPKTEYYTKSGIVSNKTMDCSNWEKPIIDLVFLPKYNDLAFPSGCPNINVDDRFIVDLGSSKRCDPEATKPYMVVEVEVVEIPKIPTQP